MTMVERDDDWQPILETVKDELHMDATEEGKGRIPALGLCCPSQSSSNESQIMLRGHHIRISAARRLRGTQGLFQSWVVRIPLSPASVECRWFRGIELGVFAKAFD